ncbi:U-box domain-containing protein 27 [Hibiscus syriacus]|uniref:U-box domain-containing protein 27 n=1 Tax=Hibiscus syriacus TaxID=106335 RepID=A0A6A2YN15_HIBSY|nr:uncharacterized protein LOC120159682 [Hibiscus syriacus]KAE8680709.1 U-box domain-containing protein 27 [Hibiscus syriacus]
MLSSEEGEIDVFFDSSDFLSVEEPVLAKVGSESGKLEYGIWMDKPRSVEERRQRFLRGMDLVHLSKSSRMEDLDRITECSDAVSSSSFSPIGNGEGCISVFDREMCCEANLLIDESEKELKVMEAQEHFDESENGEVNPKKFKKWWKHFLSMRKGEGRRSSKVMEPSFNVHKTNRMMVQSNKKRYMEFSELHMGQEIQAHKGYIWTMKFSPDGQYLATGGEDGVVRIWRVTSIDAFSKPLMAELCLGRSMEKGKFGFGREKSFHSQVIIPNENFWIKESPIHEFHGHSSDVLDVAWSNSNFLVSSSMDKTVRLWQVGCDQCLNVFHHNNYVTCIQLNPIDNNYFISGSIDGKVRIWGVSEKRVVHWIDVRDIITAICFRPDGKEFIVGSIRGTCQFYVVSGDGINLEAEVQIPGRKKSLGNKITSIQFCQDEPHKVMVASKDSKLRILDGVDIVRKFKGLPKSGSQMSASFTSTGRHIISVGEDCHIYVWNYDNMCPRTSKHTKSVSSCEHFFCEDVSIAIPWLGQGSDRSHSDSYPREHQIEGASRIIDSQRFSLGNWFSIDSSFKGSATWPEEKLPLWDTAFAEDEFYAYDHQQFYRNGDYHTVLPETWGLFIVAGSQNGTIRTIQNYGLPVTL